MAAPERIFVGLGANVGDAHAALDAALQALGELPGTVVEACSSLYRTAPVDAGGADYLNAVAELSTTLAPAALLLALHRIEDGAGRERPYHHAPRTLDLDLLVYGQRVIDTAGLQVPHPQLHRRAFVLVPLLEIAPAISHPRLGLLADHLSAVAGQAIERMP